MLHKDKMMHMLKDAQQLLWYDNHESLTEAREIWLQSEASTTVPVQPCMETYSVYAVDGSQIYPDRHHGLQCALINIGTVQFMYGENVSHAFLESYPALFATDDATDVEEWVDGKRQELELLYAVQLLQQMVHAKNGRPILLFDGSLSFCATQAKLSPAKERFNLIYQQLLYQLYEMNADVAWYVSMPQSKELMQKVCAAQQNKMHDLSAITDAQLLEPIIPVHMHTPLFNSVHADNYPLPLRPHFLYGNNGYEIMRLEIPAWIATDATRVARIVSCVEDQVAKGYGYPVSIAEAHEQAVVTTDDKYFFYAALQTIAQQQRKNFQLSQKLKKKMKLAM